MEDFLEASLILDMPSVLPVIQPYVESQSLDDWLCRLVSPQHIVGILRLVQALASSALPLQPSTVSVLCAAASERWIETRTPDSCCPTCLNHTSSGQPPSCLAQTSSTTNGDWLLFPSRTVELLTEVGITVGDSL